MRWIEDIREQPWRITVAAVGGLLVAIIIAGLVGLLLNRNIESTADGAKYSVGLEDEGDDLRAAVLDVRHYHRNLYFQVQEVGITRSGVADFENAYDRLQHELHELENVGVRDPDLPQPEEIRSMAESYYAEFGPAIESAEENPREFEQVSISTLRDIEEMENAATKIDEVGEDISADALQRVDRASTTATVVLLAVIGGLVLVGAGLAYAAVRVVTELRRLYADQRVTAEKLAEVSKAKTDFLADASHELRTPLTVLRGNAQVGLSLDGSQDHREILEEIVEESRRMSRMVEDLLFLARSDSASLPPLEAEVVSVESLVSGLAERAKALARERGVGLGTDLSGEGEAEIDRSRVEQAVLILVDNAAKYGARGGRVTLSSGTSFGELSITVADRGPGIPEEELSRIFERFYRMDKTRSRKLGGSGLGLPIAKTIVEAHEGRIEAESRVGGGTRMSLYLPLISETDVALPGYTSWRDAARS